MKKIIKMLVVSTILLTGCSSTKAETPQEKTPYEKGNERVSNILDPGKIEQESDESHKMDMTISDFGFLTHRQFHDFVFNQKNRGKFKVLKVYLDNGAVILVSNGDELIYGIPVKTVLKYEYANFKYDSESGLYKHTKTNKYLEVNRNAAYPNYFE